MPKSKTGRPEWFKFWRRYRDMIDDEEVSLESRGVILTNVLRYFDEDPELLEMSPLEKMAFRTIKANVDDAFREFEQRQETNRNNGSMGGRPKKETEKTEWV